jgi:hypothetical protein
VITLISLIYSKQKIFGFKKNPEILKISPNPGSTLYNISKHKKRFAAFLRKFKTIIIPQTLTRNARQY